MKHIFVINPKAGKVDRVKEIEEKLKSFDNKIDYETYETKSRGDATKFVKNYLATHDDKETYRFYACGGDGTLHDVINGAYPYKNVEVACYACGSGNDFIKYFGAGPGFNDLEALINGTGKCIDLIDCGEKICVNIFSMGFDAEVTIKMHDYKRKPLVSGKMAYNLAALNCLLFNMKNQLKVTVDDELLYEGNSLLIAIGNGHTYGGGFKCCPLAVADDGLLDICLAKTVKRAAAPGLMGKFKKGEHLNNKKFEDIIIYKKAKKILLESPKEVAYQMDGEAFKTNRIEVKVIPNAIKFVIPKEA